MMRETLRSTLAVFQRPITCVKIPLNRSANFKIHSHVMSLLPIFHRKPFDDPYYKLDFGIFLVTVLTLFSGIMFIISHFV